MINLKLVLLPSFLFSLLTFLLSCNLFNPPEDDYWEKIEEEIRWANAQELEITIAMPPEWGSSPQTVRIYDQVRTNDAPRMGYPFDVEFTPNSGYAFVGWLAFESDEYSLAKVLAMADFEEAEGESLNGKGVDITEWEETQSGSYLSGVTVNVSVPIMLVPYCDTRLRIERSNPPLTQTLNYYPYDQRIQLWFNMAVDLSTVWVDEVSGEIGKNIRIVTDNSDITDCFFISEYNSNERRIDISVKTDRDYSGDLQVRIINVIVGPDIKSIDGGHEMAGEQTITYMTDTSEMQKIYEAQNIQVFRDDRFYFQDFGTVWGDPEIDRRYKKDHTDSAKSTVELRFSVSAPQGAPLVPNSFYVYEHVYADLGGIEYTPSQLSEAVSYPGLMPSGNVYTINHVLQTDKPGLVRLIVIPWNENTDNPALHFPPQKADEALAAGRYVTVVMDNAPPGINDMEAVFTGGGYDIDEEVYTYSTNATLTLTLEGLGSLNDNAISDVILGIHYAEARNRPWTMDDRRDLSWRVKVGKDWKSGWNTVYKTHSTDLNNVFEKKFSDEDFPESTEDDVYIVTVEFKDRLYNVYSVDAGSIKIITIGDPISVTELTASVNETGNVITVSWITSADTVANMQGAHLYVDEVLLETVTGTGSTVTENKSPEFSVLPINADNVRAGQPASGFTSYNISVVGYNDAGSAPAVKVTVWNIPGMSVTLSNTIQLMQANFTETMQAANSNEQLVMSNYVLTSDITVKNWEPVSFNDRSFYGNGHTVTIKKFDTAYNGSDYGFFADVGDGALIRDLTIVYETAAGYAVSPENEGSFGGIAGTVSGGAILENVLVKGAVTVNGTGEVYAGGMVGHITSTTAPAAISNAYSGLSLSVNRYGYIGGAVGAIGSVSAMNIYLISEAEASAAILERISIMGNITISSSGDRVLFAGGLAGFVYGKSDSLPTIFKDADYKNGTIIINSGLYIDYIGGFIGFIAGNTDIQNCSALAESIIIDKDNNTALGQYLFAGGFTGNLDGTNNNVKNCYSENTIIMFTEDFSGSVFIGGFVGVLNGDLAYCYAKSELIIKGGTLNNNVGGFVGQGRGGSIKFCYASVNVSFVVDFGLPNFNNIGGFAGYITSCHISHSYSLGDLYINTTQSGIDAGGFIGRAEYNVENCFALGTVMAHCYYDPDTYGIPLIRVGGLIGLATGKIEKCVAAVHPRNINSGMSLAATGGFTRNIGRIYGSSNITTHSNNYAWNGIRLFIDSRYEPQNPAELTALPVLNGVPVLQANPAPLMGGSLALRGSITPGQTVITGISLSDPSGTGIASSAMSGTNGTWNGRTAITGIDLNSLAAINDTIQFDITLQNNAGSSSVYSIEVSRTSTANGDLTDFNVAYMPDPVITNMYTLSGIYPSDTGGFGLASVSMTVARHVNVTLGDPQWDGNKISGIDLSEFTLLGRWLEFNFSLEDRAGNIAVYQIRIARAQFNPHYITGPTLDSGSSSPAVANDASGQHGADATSGFFRSRVMWASPVTARGMEYYENVYTTINGVEKIYPAWDFTGIEGRGYPRLKTEDGGIMGGQ